MTTTESKIDMEYLEQVSCNIFRQLGHRARVMMGASAYVKSHKDGLPGLCFRIKSPKVKAIRISLTPKDEYNVEFLNNKFNVIKTVDGIYADMMHEIISSETGLTLEL